MPKPGEYELEIAERPGDLYERPEGPVPVLYPRPVLQPASDRRSEPRPATDLERRAIIGPVLARMRKRLEQSDGGHRAA